MEKTNGEILFNLQNEGEKAFSKLYDQFSPALYGLILKWVKDKTLVETILGKVFVSTWQSRKGYDSNKERIFIWLYRISHNTSMHYLKYKKQ